MKKGYGAINAVWAVLAITGLIYAAVSGNVSEVTSGALEAGKDAVSVCIGLAGVMCLWMGVMKIAERSGMLKAVSRLLGPLVRMLFPSLPENHTAAGAITMNVTANLLGLGNAATPFGIKAMQELQKLNGAKDTASDEMVMFLAMNTSSVTLIPATVISLRSAAGSSYPSEIVGPVIFASAASTVFAILITKLMCRGRHRKKTNVQADR